MKKRNASNALTELMEMPCEARIKVVEKDIASGLDYYKQIDSSELAKALEIPLAAFDGTDPDLW